MTGPTHAAVAVIHFMDDGPALTEVLARGPEAACVKFVARLPADLPLNAELADGRPLYEGTRNVARIDVAVVAAEDVS